MAINETTSKGNKYRRLKDATNKVWQRLSFWTAASDVEFDNGSTAEAALGSITGITDSLTSTSSNVAASAAAVSSLNSKITSFQTGVNALYNKFVALGVTPSAKTLDAMMNATQSVYTAGKKAAEFKYITITPLSTSSNVATYNLKSIGLANYNKLVLNESMFIRVDVYIAVSAKPMQNEPISIIKDATYNPATGELKVTAHWHTYDSNNPTSDHWAPGQITVFYMDV